MGGTEDVYNTNEVGEKVDPPRPKTNSTHDHDLGPPEKNKP